MEQITSFEFTGTAAEFEKACVTLNGKPMDKITVGNLAKHGILSDAGNVDKIVGRRGPVAKKFRAESRPGLIFGIIEDCNPTGEAPKDARCWPFPTANASSLALAICGQAKPDEESPI